MNTTENGTSVAAPNFAKFDVEKAISFTRRYDPKEQATEGYRNVKIGYRETKKNPIPPEPKVVSIPQVSLGQAQTALEMVTDTDTAKLSAVLLGAIEDGQDAMVRYMVDGENRKVINWQEVSLSATLEFLTTARASQRLTREGIEAWIDSALLPTLNERGAELAANKLITAPALIAQQQVAVVARYKSIIGGLSAAVQKIAQEEAIAAVTILKRANLADEMSKVLLAKLDALLNPPAANNGDL